jgi:hypothetical protein
MLAVEHPRLIPAMFCFTAAFFFLVQMQHRLKSPSPWRRCFSFGHYVRVLVTGKSSLSYTAIEANQGWDETKAQDEALKKRIEHDEEFFEKKEAVEKELEEIEQVKVETQSKVIPLELLVVLGKVQAIVGGTLNTGIMSFVMMRRPSHPQA